MRLQDAGFGAAGLEVAPTVGTGRAVLRRGIVPVGSGTFQHQILQHPGTEAGQPDIQFSFMPARRNPRRNVGFGHGYAMSTIVLRPHSRGSVRLAGREAEQLPLIDLGLLTDARDVQLILRGLKIARRVLNAEPFAPYQGHESLPGATVTDDASLIEFIRNNCGTTFHPVGTCAMGSGPNHVVNAKLAVHGMQALRVVDAAIMPGLIGGNTNGPTVMIAEKAAEMILAGSE